MCGVARSTATIRAWNPGIRPKLAARLQAATASGKPVLLRLDHETGHEEGTTKRQLLEEYADTLSFMLWQVGVKEFQPKERSRWREAFVLGCITRVYIMPSQHLSVDVSGDRRLLNEACSFALAATAR